MHRLTLRPGRHARMAIAGLAIAAALALGGCVVGHRAVTDLTPTTATLTAVARCDGGRPVACRYRMRWRAVGTRAWTLGPLHGPVRLRTGRVTLRERITGLSPGTRYRWPGRQGRPPARRRLVPGPLVHHPAGGRRAATGRGTRRTRRPRPRGYPPAGEHHAEPDGHVRLHRERGVDVHLRPRPPPGGAVPEPADVRRAGARPARVPGVGARRGRQRRAHAARLVVGGLPAVGRAAPEGRGGRRHPPAVPVRQQRRDRGRGGEVRHHPHDRRPPVPVGDAGRVPRGLGHRPVGAEPPEDVPGARADARRRLAQRLPAAVLQRRGPAPPAGAGDAAPAPVVQLQPRRLALHGHRRRVLSRHRPLQHRGAGGLGPGRPGGAPRRLHDRLLAPALLDEPDPDPRPRAVDADDHAAALLRRRGGRAQRPPAWLRAVRPAASRRRPRRRPGHLAPSSWGPGASASTRGPGRRPTASPSRPGTDGVLDLTLRAGSYGWRFQPTSGGTYTDSGMGTCH